MLASHSKIARAGLALLAAGWALLQPMSGGATPLPTSELAWLVPDNTIRDDQAPPTTEPAQTSSTSANTEPTVGDNETPSTSAEAQTSATNPETVAGAAPSPLETIADQQTSPLFDVLRQRGFRIENISHQDTVLRGPTLEFSAIGREYDFFGFIAEQLVNQGYTLLIEPVAVDQVQIVLWLTRPGQTSEARVTNLQGVELTGATFAHESLKPLRKLLPEDSTEVDLMALMEQFHRLGYQTIWAPLGPRRLGVSLKAGRAIRRIHIHGNLPLAERDVLRVLGPTAQVGMLVRGECQHKRPTRDQTIPLCAPGDPLCQAWSLETTTRLNNMLADNGYLRGQSKLALRCGRSEISADLHVFLDKGPAYRLGRSQVRVTGNLPSSDHRLIKRAFAPRITPLIPFPGRITRDNIDGAQARVVAGFWGAHL